MARSRDNIPGVERTWPLKVLLFPGVVIQWLGYMLVGGQRYSSVVQRTRMARSPVMTWIFSAVFYVAFYFLVIRNWQ